MSQQPPTKPEAKLLVSIVLYKPDLAKLKQCLDSVFNSTGLTLQVVLLDNSASPLPESVLQPYLNHAFKLTYIHNGANVGFGSGHNKVFQHVFPENTATIPYTLILNPDTYFGPTLLADMMRGMLADPSIGLSIPRILNPDGSLQMVNKRLPMAHMLFLRPLMARSKRLDTWLEPYFDKFLLNDIDLTRPFICPFISGCFMFFRTDLLLSLGGFDERYFLYMEDTDLSRRAASRSLTVVFSNIICMHHWERAAYNNPHLFKVHMKSAFKYFMKWGWMFDLERTRLNRQVSYYQAP